MISVNMCTWPAGHLPRLIISFRTVPRLVTSVRLEPPVEIIKKLPTTWPSLDEPYIPMSSVLWLDVYNLLSVMLCAWEENMEGVTRSAPRPSSWQWERGDLPVAVEWSYATELILSSLISALSSIFLIKINELHYWLCLLSCVLHPAPQSSLTFSVVWSLCLPAISSYEAYVREATKKERKMPGTSQRLDTA